MMNEATAMEASRHLARRLLAEGGSTDASRLAFGFRLVTSRPPTAKEITVLKKTLDHFRKEFTSDPAAARAFLLNDASNPAETAAFALLSSLLLNLDETITKN